MVGCFEDNESSILDLKLFFIRTLLDWLVAMQNQSFSSFLISLILVIFVLELLIPCTLPEY